MGQYTRSSDVNGGRIKATCPRCSTTAYLEISQGSRRRIHRCKCGKSTGYEINYRKERRETTYGPAKIVLRNTQEKKIRLNDTSIGGLSFFVGSEQALSMRRGQEVSVKFRTGGSGMAQRKVRIRNINKNRIGAQYIGSGMA